MKEVNLFSAFILLLLLSISVKAEENYWQQWVHYGMEVSLDTAEHSLSGTSNITYVNKSPDSLHRIYMHLYPNAFQVGSVKYREYKRRHYSGGISEDKPSFIRIDRFDIQNGDTTVPIEVKIDDTILEAELPSPLSPGDTLTFELDWVHQVREHNDRAGYKDDQYDFAQWYPKMVVYDKHGWQNIPFHAIGEFYGEFGTYDVKIDVPGGYIVGASGVVTDGDPGWSAVAVDTSIELDEWLESREESTTDSAVRRLVTFHAEQVHDFAWITSPNFLYESGEWNGIDIHVLYDSEKGRDWTKEVVKRGERVLEWLTTKFGEYPYPQVTITHAMIGGGMEYPMLVMNGSSSEGLIAHEIGHIWFYGILGNNEHEEAWLDEGFTTFQTGWYMMNQYPPDGHGGSGNDLFGKMMFLQKLLTSNSLVESAQWDVARFVTSGYNTPIAGSSRKSPGYSVYGYNAYSKPAMMLYNLRGYLGEERFLSAMQSYYDQWKLKHPDEERFRTAMREATGEDLDWFFDQWLHEAGYADYALTGWKSKRLASGEYEVTASILNKGTMAYPLDVEVELANGESYRPERWTNFTNRWKDDYTFTVPVRPKRITLDPDDWILDVDRRDNSSGFTPHRFTLQMNPTPGSPRDAYLITAFPWLFWYHPLDGWKPGLSMGRSYGFWTSQVMSVSYGVQSQEVFWRFRSSHDLRSILPGLKLKWRLSELEGVRGAGIQADYSGSKLYGYPPNYSFSGGYKITVADSTGYTDLYEAGKVGILFGRFEASANLGDFGGGFSIDLASSGGSVSDWDFSRLIVETKLRGSWEKIGVAMRFL
ncbi:MAG TPA: M1 family peptidase, partial [Candidatus Marinimicrobia bacterium]|nr:M1 family peptidase [Candidatus Neomarinimicrobiota bacterium]